MPLLERGSELAECVAALDSALGGRGGIVVAEGPAGIGKTELLRAVRAQASRRTIRVLAARGLEVERELAFGGVRQLLDPVLRVATPAEAAELLSGAAAPARSLLAAESIEPSLLADPEFAMMNALYWVLARLADGEPLLLAIDDAHWLDRPSLRLLDFLLPRIEELRALVIVATRPPRGGLLGSITADPTSLVIRLRPLSRAAVAGLVEARLGEPAPEFVDACVDVTGGNAFYLTELLREFAERDARPTSTEAATVRSLAPQSVSRALRFREVTSSDGAALARALAVLGDGSALEHVAALAGLNRDAAESAADSLTREAILAAGTDLSFAHPIVRSVVYADLGPKQRARAHKRAADLMHGRGAAIERVAAHLMRTDPAGDPRVVEMLRAAAHVVVGQGAPDTAVQYLRRAAAEPPDDVAFADVLLELGRAELSTADPDAVSHLSQAYALAKDVRTRAAAAGPAAYQLFILGRGQEGIAMLAAVAEELGRENRHQALELEAQLVSLAMYLPESRALYVPLLDRVGDDLAADSTGSRMMLCQRAYQRLWLADDAGRAADLAERALADGSLIAERGADTTDLTAAALTLILADRVTPAEALLDSALTVARERGSRFGYGHVSFLRSELAYRRGSLQTAEVEAHSSLEITVGARILQGVAVATGVLVAVLLERGALEEAVGALDAMWIPLEELPADPGNNFFLAARGRTRLARGDVDGGLVDLHECGRRNQLLELRHPLLVPWRVDAALAHRARGELDAAQALAAEELAVARDWGTPGVIGSAKRLMALLSSGEEAIALLREATTALADSPARLEHARALVDLGAALRRANRRIEARDPLRNGLDLADRCGATVLSRRAREELAATGARPRRARLTGVEALTASERRIAQLAAQGLGNIEIAQSLFVTRKTVEKHLSSVYTKLDVNSRAALSSHFPEEGADAAVK